MRGSSSVNFGSLQNTEARSRLRTVSSGSKSKRYYRWESRKTLLRSIRSSLESIWISQGEASISRSTRWTSERLVNWSALLEALSRQRIKCIVCDSAGCARRLSGDLSQLASTVVRHVSSYYCSEQVVALRLTLVHYHQRAEMMGG